MRTAAQLQRKLTGMRCRCAACSENFNSVSVFDRHRVGSPANRRCLSMSEMFARGWSVNGAGFWIRSQMPASRDTAMIPDVIDKAKYEGPTKLSRATARAARYGAFAQVEAPPL